MPRTVGELSGNFTLSGEWSPSIWHFVTLTNDNSAVALTLHEWPWKSTSNWWLEIWCWFSTKCLRITNYVWYHCLIPIEYKGHANKPATELMTFSLPGCPWSGKFMEWSHSALCSTIGIHYFRLPWPLTPVIRSGDAHAWGLFIAMQLDVELNCVGVAIDTSPTQLDSTSS